MNIEKNNYAIEGIDLWKTYTTRTGGFRGKRIKITALHGLTISVPIGKIYGLLGPNGAGKTTFVKIITTLLLPDRGSARVLNYNVVEEPSKVRENIGVMLSVERGFFWKLTGYENLLYFAMIYGLPRKQAEERVEHLLELVGLKQLGGDEKRFEDMSLGMKARLGLARALLRDPPVLILDEPTLGLDPMSARKLRSLLVELTIKENKTILLTTHNMYEAEEVCNTVGIIRKGKLIAEDTPRSLKHLVSEYYSVRIVGIGDKEKFELVAREIAEKHGRLSYNIIEKNGRLTMILLAPIGKEEKILSDTITYAVKKGLRVTEARIIEPTLEDVFIKLSGGVPLET